jgi:dihydroorotase
VLNAEKLFLTHLRKLAADFPKLRIVLEHATTAEAIECVRDTFCTHYTTTRIVD